MKLHFLGKSHETADVWTFSFAVPHDKSWLAGQSIRLELPVGYDIEEKRFTISSAPFEDRLDITTKLSGSKFKNSLNQLQAGQTIDGQSIEGDFVWANNSQPKLLIASGVGITPFHSMLKQLDFDNQEFDFSLVYADRHDRLVFEDWLVDLAKSHPAFRLKLIPGRRLQLSDLPLEPNHLVYLSGPASMVDQLGRQLLKGGLLERNLRRDIFTGHAGWFD